MKSKVLALAVVILLAAVMPVMAACAPEEVPPAPPAAPTKPAAPAKPVAPAKPAEVHKWRFQTFLPSGEFAYPLLEKMCDDIRTASQGRLDITLYPGGALVPFEEFFSGTGKGVIEMIDTVGSWHADVIPVAHMPSGGGMLIWAEPYELWEAFVHESGFADIVREAHAEHNTYWIGNSEIGIEMGSLLSRVPIRSLDDYKGLKIRAYGRVISGLFERLGATTVYVPPEEIYTSLATGAIDAVQYGTQIDCYKLGFHEVAKYYTMPPLGSVTGCEFIANLDAWNKLSGDLKLILKWGADSLRHDYLRKSVVENSKVMTEWQEKFGIEICTLPDDEWKELRRIVETELWPELAQEDPRLAKAIEMWNDYVELAKR